MTRKSMIFIKACAWFVAAFLLIGKHIGPVPARGATTGDGASQQYFVPLMMHGPNNQIIAIRETLALAGVLGRTIVLPDLQAHLFTDKNEEPMRFTDLFDAAYVKSHTNAVLLEELPDRLGGPSWNRTPDAILLMVKPEQIKITPGLLKALDLQAPPRDRWFDSPVTSWHGCDEDRLQQLRELLAPYQVVGVQTFHGLLYGCQWLAGPMLMACTDACCKSYQQALPLIRKSPAIYRLADRFIKERLGGEPFVAAHLRPYPDACIRVWMKPDPAERVAVMNKLCNNEYLMDRFVPSIQHIMQKYRVRNFFLMTHPRVREVARALLLEGGIEPVFMDLGDIKPEPGDLSGFATNVSFSLLAMVEEAVCTRAKAFIGTKESSMTGTIVQERIVHGLPVHDSYTFFRRKGYEQQPVGVDEFYKLTNMSVRGTERWRSKLRNNGVDVDG